jgi:hypothetical protein
MRPFPRRRFADLVDRQLDLFGRQNGERLAQIRDAYRQVNAAGREEAEAAFGDYQDQIGWAAEELAELRDAYAGTLDDEALDGYVRAFARGVRRRYPALADVMMRSVDDVDEI